MSEPRSALLELHVSGDGMGVESVPPGCVLDVQGTLARFGGDKGLFVEIAGFFFEDAPRLFADLQQAVQEEDAGAIRMSAHALKGLVAGCGGVRAAHAAQKVETAGHEGDLTNIVSLVESLGDELELLKHALQPYCA